MASDFSVAWQLVNLLAASVVLMLLAIKSYYWIEITNAGQYFFSGLLATGPFPKIFC
jgi:uncharacterized membrane protein